MAQKNYPTNIVSIYNTDFHGYTNFQIEGFKSTSDITIKIKPSNSIFMSSRRLEKYVENLQKFIDDPITNPGISKPSITSNVVNSFHSLDIGVTGYESYSLTPFACLEYEIASDSSFGTIILNGVLHEEKTKLNIDIKTLTNGTYYFRVRYGGGGVNSEWSDGISFNVSKATLSKPEIIGVSISYTDYVPFDAVVTFKSSLYQDTSPHNETRWRVYHKEGEEWILDYTEIGDRTKLTMVMISNLFPNVLSHNVEYYVTAQYFDDAGGFSEESEKYRFISDGVKVSTPEDITIFPSIVNISDPTINFFKDITLKINGYDSKNINYNDVENVYWELTEVETGYKTNYTTKTNILNLVEGSLIENTRYRISVYYVHKYLGRSDEASFEFKTTSNFISVEDGLKKPITVYNDTAYYGEISYDKLMSENVIYTGNFSFSRRYTVGEEVLKDGELFLCVRETPVLTTSSDTYDFNKYFKKSFESANGTSNYYKTGLPTPKWLLNNIGMNPYLTTTDLTSGDTNFINSNSGWLKVQNKFKQILYISKLPLMRNVSVNDLIRRDLFHPRRKTVRIGKNLYYVRILVHDCYFGYEALDPVYDGENFILNHNGNNIINYNEEEILKDLINGNLYSFDPSDLDIDSIEYKELIYHTEDILSYRSDMTSGTVNLVSKEIPMADQRTIYFRPVLELIPEEEKPIHNISGKIPASDESIDYLQYYDPYLDYCYLGMVETRKFITAETVDIKSGLMSGNSNNVLSWMKFYYRGLIYLVSNGTTIRNTTYRDINKYNMLTSSSLYSYNVRPEDLKLGKIIFNGVIYNISCPNVLTYTTVREQTKLSDGSLVDIFNTANAKLDLKIGYESFLSDAIYPIIRNLQEDKSSTGYKGSHRSVKVMDVIEQFGSTSLDEGVFLTSDVVKYEIPQGLTTQYVEKPIFNMQKHPTRIKTGDILDPVDFICCLTVIPTIDNIELWKK